MGFIFILPFAALAGWSIFAIHRWLRRGNYGPQWWKSFRILACVGIAAGIFLAFFFQYTVGNYHMNGFPIPAGIANRDKPDAHWKSSDMPPSIRAGARLTDFLFGIALCLAPVAVAAFYMENKGKLGGPEIPPRNLR